MRCAARQRRLALNCRRAEPEAARRPGPRSAWAARKRSRSRGQGRGRPNPVRPAHGHQYSARRHLSAPSRAVARSKSLPMGSAIVSCAANPLTPCP
jgi:hypothetical protein